MSTQEDLLKSSIREELSPGILLGRLKPVLFAALSPAPGTMLSHSWYSGFIERIKISIRG